VKKLSDVDKITRSM